MLLSAHSTKHKPPCKTVLPNTTPFGNNCWIAGNVTICGGVTIGDGCVIGAGSVVTRDIPSNSLAVGVPCRVLREITEADALENLPELF